MHERDRHRIILSAAQDRAVVTVAELTELTGASEATVRRDIASLDGLCKLRRIRGGAEAMAPRAFPGLAGRPFAMNAGLMQAEKAAIARAAAELCEDGEPIIVNGGTTTFEMVHPLASRQLQILTNSLPIAQHLLANSRNQILLPGGAIYREQNIILSPFDDDLAAHFYARRMFMGCQGLGPLGLMEADPLLIRAEEKLIGQAEELIVLADSSKFAGRSSLILCPLGRIDVVITDDGIPDAAARMLEAADVRLVTVSVRDTAGRAVAGG